MPNLVRRFQESLEGIIRRIEMQHVPEMLLKFIGSEEYPLDTANRIWAMERALDLGLTKADLRAAVLSFYDNLRRLLRDGKLPGDASRTPVSIGVVKHAAMQLGIVDATDLPEVKMPSEVPDEARPAK